ncbi:MAG: hypothetical protein ACR2PL_18745 [Dehalococcoidia bacterium]
MNRQELLMSGRIRHALDARARRGIPDSIDLWPRLEQAALAQRRTGTGERAEMRSGRRVIVVLVACVALLTTGVAAAAAASPPLRHFLQETVTGIPAGHAGWSMDTHGQPVQIQPLPPFTLFYPQSQPAGLLIRGIGQLHPRYGADGFGSGYQCPAPPAPCPPGIAVFIPPHPAVRLPTLLTPFHSTATNVVWFGSHGIPPDQRFLQIVEWDMTMSPLKSLSAAAIPTLSPGKPETLLVLSRGSTTIAIDTNLGSSEAQQVADSLQPLTLNTTGAP